MGELTSQDVWKMMLEIYTGGERLYIGLLLVLLTMCVVEMKNVEDLDMIQLNVAGPGAAAAELAARAKAATAARQLEKWKQGYTKQIATLQTKVKALEGLLVKKDQLLSQCSKRSKRHHPTFRLLLHRLRKWLWRRRCRSKPAARKPNIKKRRQRWGLSFGQLEKIVDPLQACSNGRKWLEQRPDGSVDTASTR